MWRLFVNHFVSRPRRTARISKGTPHSQPPFTKEKNSRIVRGENSGHIRKGAMRTKGCGRGRADPCARRSCQVGTSTWQETQPWNKSGGVPIWETFRSEASKDVLPCTGILYIRMLFANSTPNLINSRRCHPDIHRHRSHECDSGE